MLEQDSSHLKNEISRLNGIIDVLLSQNRDLSADIAHLKSGNSLTQEISSYDKSEKGRNDAFSSDDKIMKGSSDLFSSTEKNVDGINDANTSYQKNEKGISQLISSNDKIEIGINESSYALPAFVEPSPQVVGRLSNALKASGLKKVKRTGLRNMALVLLQAHNKQSCSHRELRKLTGLSEGGIAKLIMSMKKRGMIHREGYGRFAISASTREMMER